MNQATLVREIYKDEDLNKICGVVTSTYRFNSEEEFRTAERRVNTESKRFEEEKKVIEDYLQEVSAKRLHVDFNGNKNIQVYHHQGSTIIFNAGNPFDLTHCNIYQIEITSENPIETLVDELARLLPKAEVVREYDS